MFAEERQRIILEKLRKNGAVTTMGLVSEFGVSMETIRRDLLDMEKKALLTRVHGGAVTHGEMKKAQELSVRTHEMAEEKRYLSQKAVELVEENDIIGIDAGSTAYLFAEELKKCFNHLTVITFSMDVFQVLQDSDFNIILCGGHYMKEENCFYGALVLETLQKLHTKKAFIFPSAVSLKNGICGYNPELYMLQKCMMSFAEKIYILADSSKFEKNAMIFIDEMKSDFGYITDNKLSSELQQLYKENDLEITL